MVDPIKGSGFALNAQHKDDVLLVEGYGTGYFKMRSNRAEGHMIILASGFFPLEALTMADITENHVEKILSADIKPDLVLIGTGEKMIPLPRSLRALFEKNGIGVEFMDTGAACRTYNVLTLENRRVAALLMSL
ncbi:Mth938-like domain-containing protein [Temperatibacter marinus]|uniref:Mth938-like domain-containing protein n=1 Tax=Temperatibacter marinus TaxID=1456591 RepID=A0AA52H8Y8_9PROT|nr:Mth938-like domain-containing protein [Temperatibacter marinus]WND02616.1 Mth938-like domain-containing protein [Temperatibacter marinus]